jgi:hypothetical protein
MCEWALCVSKARFPHKLRCTMSSRTTCLACTTNGLDHFENEISDTFDLATASHQKRAKDADSQRTASLKAKEDSASGTKANLEKVKEHVLSDYWIDKIMSGIKRFAFASLPSSNASSAFDDNGSHRSGRTAYAGNGNKRLLLQSDGRVDKSLITEDDPEVSPTTSSNFAEYLTPTQLALAIVLVSAAQIYNGIA